MKHVRGMEVKSIGRMSTSGLILALAECLTPLTTWETGWLINQRTKEVVDYAGSMRLAVVMFREMSYRLSTEDCLAVNYYGCRLILLAITTIKKLHTKKGTALNCQMAVLEMQVNRHMTKISRGLVH